MPLAAPRLDVYTSTYPEYAAHVRKAINSGLPSTLQRMTDATKKKANYNKACPSSIPRPSGRSCDEYPFQSTYQGAALNGGSVRVPSGCYLDVVAGSGPTGFSRCMIIKAQNSLGGSVLNAFYQNSRVLDKDKFTVRVV